ncbi:MAG: hypothetical protein ISR58_04805 [Anaerolineales bacterium]|nr:hypothetical protein [Chloroflexota bacterium]MBL6980491.1 hypothetical protein [Anaerolineales bacterium]
MERSGKSEARLGMLILLVFIIGMLLLTSILRNQGLNNLLLSMVINNEELTASLPSAIPEEEAPFYQIAEEHVVGKYVYRLWEKDSDVTSLEGDYPIEYVTLSLVREPSVNIKEIWGMPVTINFYSGKDITGEGNPDLIVESHSGGTHCCFQYYVFDLGETALSTYLETQPSNCFGEFKDMDNDGTYEFFSCDDILAYSYCSYASSPMAPLVLKFVPGVGYLPATPNYKNAGEISMRITTDVVEAELGKSQGYPESDRDAVTENVLCPAIQVALDYLYIGERESAEKEFYRLYNYSDVNVIWWNVDTQVSKGRLYTPVELVIPQNE